MYNNNPNNVWPPLVYQYGTQAVGQMALNGNVLPQNVNYVQQYYGQNQAYGLGQTRPGQQYTHWFYEHMNHQHNPYGQTQVTPAITAAYLAHPSGQTVPIQTNKQTFHSQPSNPSAAGLMAANHSEKWMELLNPKDRQVLDQLNKEQHEFEQMFKNWENDFEDWQRKNRSHPDINAYNTYVSQWQQWRQKLVEKQKEMVTRTAQTLQQLKSQVQPLMSPTTASQPSRVPPPPPPQVPPPPPDPPKQPPPPPPTPPKTNKNNSNSKKTTTIEVIEIDCEESVKMSKSQPKPESIPDPTLVSKAAEDMLFIQKQQELLKSLENLKSDKRGQEMTNNTTGEDVQLVEPKPFDMNDIVNKMKAIKHPEDPTEANKILSDLPALQGIVFTPRSPSASNTHPNDYNRPFNNIRPDQRMPARRPFHGDHNSSRFQTPPYGPSIGNRPPFTHFSPSGPVNRWPAPRQPLRQQSPPVRRQYSAQTIDYNHRPETRDLSPNQKPLNSPSAFIPNQFSYDNHNHYNRYKPNLNSTETFDCSRKPPISLPVTKPMPEMRQMEEIFSYNDIRYFTQPKSRIVLIDDLLKPPTREFRPANIVIILRGLPGSGKTYFAKLIKEMEMEFGGSAPRILSIDDYFMAEVEREVKAPDTGKMVKTKEYAYEYEKEMESYYRASLLKTYKKTVDDRLFSFIIIDAVNELIADIEDFYSYAIKNDFVVYVIEMMSNDPSLCHKDNVHNRKLEDIKQIHSKWQTLPEFMLRLDIRSLLQKESIKEVEMESIDMSAKQSGESAKRKVEIEDQSPNKHSKLSFDPYEEEEAVEGETRLSRWERMEASDSKLDKLDSFRMKSKPTIEEYLQVTDDYELRNRDQQKRVRWADIEEQEKQQRIRERGFEVGLNWQQYMDPQHPHRLLTETKYF